MPDSGDFLDLDCTLPVDLAARMAQVTEDASMAFWAKVAEGFPEVTTGDFGPGETNRMDRDQTWAVHTWLYYNWPHRGPEPNIEPRWEGPAPEREQPPNDDERLEVIQHLQRHGIVAHHDYPGVVCITLRNGLRVNTGMHGWDYGSWMDAGEPIEDGQPAEYELRHNAGAEELTDPEAIADVWRNIVNDVEESW